MIQYLKVIEAATPYATRMSRLRNRIFGNIIRRSDMESKKVVDLFSQKPFYKKDEVVNYYYRHMETFHLMTKLRKYGLFRDEHHDFQEEMKRLRRLRGKIKPQKGKGKQAVTQA